jgi:hypothetical protein
MSLAYRNSAERLAFAVDPAVFMADKTGTTNSYRAWKSAIDYAIARAPQNGGIVYIKPSPGKYRLDWNGATGVDVGLPGISVTSLNTRSIFVIDDPNVTDVILDVSGCSLKMGGTDKDDWATFLTVVDASLTVIHDGTTYDYVNLLTTQGTITAIQAPTSGDNGYVEFTRDPAFPAPSFTTCSEVRTCSALQYTLAHPDQHFTKLVMNRNEYEDDFAAITLQSGTTHRISGLTSAETTAYTNNGGAGTYISVSAASDCGQWYKTIAAPAAHYVGKATCHQAMQHFTFNVMTGKGGVTVEGLTMVPRHGTNVMTSCMRTGLGGNYNFGRYQYLFNTIKGTGDDGIAANGGSLTDMTYVGATSFTAFAGTHYYGKTLPAGTRFRLYDTSAGGYSEVAYGTITAAGSITTAGGAFSATYAVELGSGSGALPTNMADHIAVITDTYNPVTIAFNDVSVSRSRNFWVNIASGTIAYNTAALSTDEGIKVHVNGGGNASVGYPGGSRLHVKGNTLWRNCRDTYPAALMIFASAFGDEYTASVDKVIGEVLVEGNTVVGAPYLGMLFGGISNLTERNNTFSVVGLGTPISGLISYDMGFTSKTVVGYVNCDKGSLGRGSVFETIDGAAPYVGLTAGGGSNVKVAADFYTDHDLATAATGVLGRLGTVAPDQWLHINGLGDAATTLALIEADNGYGAGVRTKSGPQEYQVTSNDTGWRVRDQTAGLNRLQLLNDGHFSAGASATQDWGTSAARWRAVYGRNANFDGTVRLVCGEYTAAQIADVTHTVNTTDKAKGVRVWDTTNNRELRASGSTAVSAWHVIGGGTTVTPA